MGSMLSTTKERHRLSRAASRGNVQAIEEIFRDAGSNRKRTELLARRNDAGDFPLMGAAAGGHDRAVKLLLEAGAVVNATNSEGRTALHQAARACKKGVACAQLLINAGANVNARDQQGHTVLHEAAVQAGGAPLCRLLIDRGANVKAVSTSGVSPLNAACRFGHTAAAVEVLVTAGAPVNERLREMSPLCTAALAGHSDVAVALLAHGASPDDAAHGVPVLILAAGSGATEACRALLRAGASPNVRASSGATALYVAAENDQSEMAAVLLDAGADPNLSASVSRCGETPLHVAAKSGFEDVVRALLGKTALGDAVSPAADGTTRRMTVDVNLRDADGWTPLLHAIADQNDSIVQLLLDAGAQVTTECALGQPVFLHATLAAIASCKARFLKGAQGEDAQTSMKRSSTALRICSLLLEHGADVTAASRTSLDTPLLVAAASVCAPVAHWLLDHGAFEKLEKNIPTALTRLRDALATSSGMQALRAQDGSVSRLIARLCRECKAVGADHPTASLAGTVSAPDGWLQSALRRYPLLTSEDGRLFPGDEPTAESSKNKSAGFASAGWTLLHQAAAEGKLDRVRELLPSQDIHACTHGGATALLLAAVGGHVEVLQALVKAGASLRAGNHLGVTPLHAAADCGHMPCVSAVLAVASSVGVDDAFTHPVNTNAPLFDMLDAYGMSPLHHAALYGRREVCLALAEARACLWAEDDEWKVPMHPRVRMALRNRMVRMQGVTKTPVVLAARAGHIGLATELVNLLQTRRGPQAAASMCAMAAVQAAGCGSVEATCSMLDLFSRFSAGALQADMPDAGILAQNALIVASQTSQSAVVEALLARRVPAVPTVPMSPVLWQPVHAASCAGNVRVLEALLRGGADPTAPCRGGEASIGMSPLEIATTCGHLSVVRVLLAAIRKTAAGDAKLPDMIWSTSTTSVTCPASPGKADSRALCPLFRAAQTGVLEVFEELFVLLPASAQQASLQARDTLGMNMLQWSALAGSAPLVRRLLTAGVSPCGSGSDEKADNTALAARTTPLYAAADSHDVETVQVLLDAGAVADLERPDPDGMTPLLVAIKADSVGIVRALLAVGASVNTAADEIGPALHCAAASGAVACVPVLLDAGAPLVWQPNTPGAVPSHALYFAAVFGHVQVVRQLLAAGADINATSPEGPTALLAAVNGGHVSAAKALLKAGADPNVKLEGPLTPGRPRLTTLMSAIVGDVHNNDDVRNHNGISSTRLSLLRALLEGGADFTALSYFPQAGAPTGTAVPLIAATEQCDLHAVCMLLAAGADPRCARNDGMTPVHIATAMADPKILEALLCAGGGDVVNALGSDAKVPPMFLLPDVRAAGAQAGGADGWQRTIVGAKVHVKGLAPSSGDCNACLELLCLHGAEIPTKD